MKSIKHIAVAFSGDTPTIVYAGPCKKAAGEALIAAGDAGEEREGQFVRTYDSGALWSNPPHPKPVPFPVLGDARLKIVR